jgi:hypothetical protein
MKPEKDLLTVDMLRIVSVAGSFIAGKLALSDMKRGRAAYARGPASAMIATV